jgi:RNA polymerase sigma factor (sigma-70 family)
MTYQIDVRDHQGLVGMVVRPWLKTIKASGCIDFDDLMQVGNLALMRAAETYDESKGAWSTYACYWVRHHVHREVADKVRTVRVETVPTRIHEDVLDQSERRQER